MKKTTWQILSCLMVVALVLLSCTPTVTEEEEEIMTAVEEVVTLEEEVVTPEEEVAPPAIEEVVTSDEELAEEVLKILDVKGIAVEASGMLLVRLYEGKRGTSVAIELKNVRELRVYDRDGVLTKVLAGEKAKVE